MLRTNIGEESIAGTAWRKATNRFESASCGNSARGIRRFLVLKEGWETGGVHGAFVLKSSLDRVEDVVRADMINTVQRVVPMAWVIAIDFRALNQMVAPGRIPCQGHGVQDGRCTAFEN